MANVDINVRVNQRGAQRQMDRLARSTQQTKRQFDKLTVSIRQSSGAFGSFAGNVAAVGFTRLVSSMGDFIRSSFQVTGQVETIATQFEVLTGSAEQAEKAVRDLQTFAANTPFRFQDLAKAEQRLLSFGFSLEDSQEKLSELGDVAAASGADISELALIFGQVQAAGKLTGERLLQFQERAIPIGPALAKSLGVTESSIRQLVSEGKVSFADFEKAFETLNDTGEFAFEGMAKRSQTLEGRLSTLGDNFEALRANVGSRFAPAFKALVSIVTQFIQRLQDSRGFQSFIQSIADSIPRAINIAFGAFSAFIDIVSVLRTAWQRIIAVGFTVVDTVLKIAETTLRAESAVKGFFGLDTGTIDAQIQGLQAFRSGLEETAVAAVSSDNAIENSRQSLQDSILEGNQIIQDALKQEMAATQENATSAIQANTARAQKVQETTKIEKDALEALAEAKRSLQQLELEDRLVQQGDDQIFRDEKLIAIQEFFTAEQEAAIQAKIALAETETEKQTLITQAQADGIKARRKQEEENLKELRAAEDAYTKFQADQDKIREQNRRGSLSTISTLSRSNNRELAAIGKAAGITQIAIDTPVAVSKALAAFPPPFNFVAAGAVAAAMAAQAAQIAGVSFEQGGIVPGTSFTGDNVLANVNSGEMILNRQQQATLFKLAANGGNMAGSQEIVSNITVELDGEVVGNAVSRQVANGLQLGEVQ